MSSRLKNITNLFANTKARVFLLVTFASLFVALGISYLVLTRDEAGPKSAAHLQPLYPISSTPGATTSSDEYVRLQTTENINRADDAFVTGRSAIPTVTRASHIDIDELLREGFDVSTADLSHLTDEEYMLICDCDEYGYDRDGYDRDGYDAEGYDRNGLDRFGNPRPVEECVGYDADGYDCDGYDREGFNRNGYDRDGYDREGYNQGGYNRDGFNREGEECVGYDADGYDCDGYDRDGFDRNGFDRDGYDRDGFDRNGFDRNGYDRDGYDRDGFDRNGYDRDGFNRQGYDKDGFDRNGYDREGFDRNGFDRNGYDREGYDKNGFNREGYNRDGFNKDGLDRDGYDRNGYDKDGYNKYGYDKNGTARNPNSIFDRPGGANDNIAASNLLDGMKQRRKLDQADMSDQDYFQQLNATRGQMATQASQLFAAWLPPPGQQYVMGAVPEEADLDAAALAALAAGENANKGAPVIRAGTILFASLHTAVNSDEPGPILARVVGGRFKGAQLIGQLRKPGQYAKGVTLNFNTMTVPTHPQSIRINAVAIDPNTSRTGVSTRTNNHYLLRYGSLFASSFLEGYGDALMSSGSTAISILGMPIGYRRDKLSEREQALYALGHVGSRYSRVLGRNFTRPPTIHVASGTSLGILFLSDLYISD